MRLKNGARYLVLTNDNRIWSMTAQKHQEWGGVIALFNTPSPVPYHYKEFKMVLKLNDKNLQKLKKEVLEIKNREVL